ncbi:hypothetical protein Hanom_Chr07g00678811 [Helianthus anomalus]
MGHSTPPTPTIAYPNHLGELRILFEIGWWRLRFRPDLSAVVQRSVFRQRTPTLKVDIGYKCRSHLLHRRRHSSTTAAAPLLPPPSHYHLQINTKSSTIQILITELLKTQVTNHISVGDRGVWMLNLFFEEGN